MPTLGKRAARFLPHLIWMAGLLIVFAGFLAGPGIPYQDPTPEQRLLEAKQMHLEDQFIACGFALFVGGIVVASTIWLIRHCTNARTRR